MNIPDIKLSDLLENECKVFAQDLKERMEDSFPGTKWEIEIWENCGWHYKVHCGTIAIYTRHNKNSEISYGTACGDEIGNTSGTLVEWSISDDYEFLKLPEERVKLQLEAVKSDIKRRQKILDYNLKMLKLK